jgi:hypothetical protein
MKRIICLALALVWGVGLYAQQPAPPKTQKFWLGVTAGIGIPSGAFASTTTSDGGMATTGFQATLHGGYTVAPRFGWGGNFFYSTYGLNTGMFTGINVKLDHWQYYGLTVGPYVNLVETPNLEVAAKLYFGAATANAPVVTLENLSTKDTWATAFTVQLGADLKYHIGRNMFLMVDANYTGMQPVFKDVDLGQYKQDIYGLHLGAGLGFRF